MYGVSYRSEVIPETNDRKMMENGRRMLGKHNEIDITDDPKYFQGLSSLF
jgi:hypothetical protein